MLDFNNEEGEFIGEIVAGGYDKVAKSWRVEYQEIDYVEDLHLSEILESLVQPGDRKGSKSKRSKGSANL